MIRTSHPSRSKRHVIFWILHRDEEVFEDPLVYLRGFSRWERTRFWTEVGLSHHFFWAITGYGPFVFPDLWTVHDVLDVAQERPSMTLTHVEIDPAAYREMLNLLREQAVDRESPPPGGRFNPAKTEDGFRLSELILSADPVTLTWELENALGNRHTPNAVVEPFADSDNEEIRRRVAHNSGISLEVLKRLAADPSRDVRIAAAQNPGATPDILQSLSEDDDEHVRAVTVAHPNTPIESLRRMGEQDRFFGLFLAQNPSIPSDIALPQLERIVVSGSDYEKAMIATHPALTPELAEKLANADDSTVRSSIAQRRDLLSPETWERLAHDSD